MQRAANNTNRFLIELFSLSEVVDAKLHGRAIGLCQNLVLSHLAHCSQISNSQHIFHSLTSKLIRLAEQAQSLRRVDLLAEVSHVLVNLPISDARKAGRYYHAIVIRQRGRADEARSLLESVADDAPVAYRARALQSLGSFYSQQGHFDEELKLQLEVLRAAPSTGQGMQARLMAHWGIAVIKSILGNHKGALADFESLAPMVRLVSQYQPYFHYEYRNSLAIELGELGRVVEAEATLAIALNSPYAAAYPEWHETRDELAAKRQAANSSQIAVSRSLPIEAEPKSQQPSKKQSQITINLRLSLSQESLILRVTGTATGQPHLCLFILDRLDETLQPRAPPSRFWCST